MGNDFIEKWDAIMGLPAAIAENPVLFLVVFAIFSPLIWWKWRITSTGLDNTVDAATHGLQTDADLRTQPHETGIGTRQVLVMRPQKTPKMIYFALIFFGGGALFYLFVHMPSDRSVPSDWWNALLLLAFAVIAMIVIESGQTCIVVDDRTIQKRRVLHRRQTIAFSDITSVTPLATTFAAGLVIRTASGDKMNVRPLFSGYRQLMIRLGHKNPHLHLQARMNRTPKRAAT